MPKVSNNKELQGALKKDQQKVVDYVIQKIWNENRSVIRHTVYMAGTPAAYYTTAANPTYYHRTYQFLESWDTISSWRVGHTANGADARATFYYKPSEMHSGSLNRDSDDFGQHIGIAEPYKGASSAPYLAEIIYEGISGGSAWGDRSHWSHKKRNAYKELIRVIGRRNLKNWIQDGMRHVGLTFIAHNKSISITTRNT